MQRMGVYWSDLSEDRPPWALFGKWKKEYGEDEVLAVIKYLSLTGKQLKQDGKDSNIRGYIVKTLQSRKEVPPKRLVRRSSRRGNREDRLNRLKELREKEVFDES